MRIDRFVGPLFGMVRYKSKTMIGGEPHNMAYIVIMSHESRYTKKWSNAAQN